VKCIVGAAVAVAASIASAQPPSQATHESPMGELAFGLGESRLWGNVKGRVHHATVAARVTERNWVHATYGHRANLDADTWYTADLASYYELGLGANRMFCSVRAPICWAIGASIGYQHAVVSEVDDLSSNLSLVFHDHSASFGEGRLAMRFAFEHVWAEISVAARVYVGDHDTRGGLAGFAVYFIP
jgi:hypothetical protein